MSPGIGTSCHPTIRILRDEAYLAAASLGWPRATRSRTVSTFSPSRGPLWLVAVVLYARAVRTVFRVVIIGDGLFACVLLALRYVREPSSTAALGILFFPISFVLALGAWVVVEWGALTLVRRARHRTR